MTPARLLLALGIAAVAAMCTGCAGLGGLLDEPTHGRGEVHAADGRPIDAPTALQAVAIGKSTKAQVRAALGEAIAIPFDSGLEVWAYRWPGTDRTPRGATELVILFDASGVATRARVRPGIASSQ